MAYDNTWSNVIPPGGDPLNTADDHIRQVRLDVDQRMDDVVGSWSSDPVQGPTVSRTIDWTAGVLKTTGGAADHVSSDDISVQSDTASTSIIWYIPLLGLPVGIVLDTVLLRVYRDDAAAVVDVDLEKIDGSPTKTDIGVITSTDVSGWHTLSISSLAHTVLADNSYRVEVLLTPGAAVTSARLQNITYTYTRTHALQGL